MRLALALVLAMTGAGGCARAPITAERVLDVEIADVESDLADADTLAANLQQKANALSRCVGDFPSSAAGGRLTLNYNYVPPVIHMLRAETDSLRAKEFTVCIEAAMLTEWSWPVPVAAKLKFRFLPSLFVAKGMAGLPRRPLDSPRLRLFAPATWRVGPALFVGPAAWGTLEKSGANLRNLGGVRYAIVGSRWHLMGLFYGDDAHRFMRLGPVKKWVSSFTGGRVRAATPAERHTTDLLAPFAVPDDALVVLEQGKDVLGLAFLGGELVWLELLSGWTAPGAP